MAPEGGGQADHKQIQRPQQEGLEGVAVLMDQKPPGQLGPFAGAPPVRNEQEQTQGGAGLVPPAGHHRAVVPAMLFPNVDQKHGKTHQGLQKAPGALAQDIQDGPYP